MTNIPFLEKLCHEVGYSWNVVFQNFFSSFFNKITKFNGRKKNEKI